MHATEITEIASSGTAVGAQQVRFLARQKHKQVEGSRAAFTALGLATNHALDEVGGLGFFGKNARVYIGIGTWGRVRAEVMVVIALVLMML